MSKRKNPSKKTRFEVFKRDRFTCQYCGSKAPDVVLHADHINPVANGGDSGIMNLVTACAACNGGKGATKLDDRSAVERQRVQIEELEARREQLEMMLAWRDAAQAEAIDVVEAVSVRMGERGGFVASESGKANIRRWLKRFSLKELLEALDESFDSYMQWNGDEPDQPSWELAFNKIPAVANMRRQAVDKPYLFRLTYVQGILRRRFDDPYGRYMSALEEAVVAYDVQPDELEAIAKASDCWEDFCKRAAAIRAEKVRAKRTAPTLAEPKDYDDPYDDDGYDDEGEA